LFGTTPLKAQNDKKMLEIWREWPPGYAYALGRTTWPLRATCRPREPHWWPLL